MEKGASSSSTALESVLITSELFWALVRGANIEANASSLIVLGRLWVMEMGRCWEKKLDRARAVEGKGAAG